LQFTTLQVSKDQAEASAIAAIVAAEEAEVAAPAAQTQRLKDEAAADLASAMPALEAAITVGNPCAVADGARPWASRHQVAALN
jgi:hypothetical protein